LGYGARLRGTCAGSSAGMAHSNSKYGLRIIVLLN